MVIFPFFFSLTCVSVLFLFPHVRFVRELPDGIVYILVLLCGIGSVAGMIVVFLRLRDAAIRDGKYLRVIPYVAIYILYIYIFSALVRNFSKG